MDRMRGMEVFVAVARSHSFSKAARQLGISCGYVTKYVAWMEETHSVRLLTRTTRNVGLTQAGEEFLEGALELLERYDQLSQNFRASLQDISGLIRIGVPPSFGAIYVEPRVSQFARLYPEVQIELCLDTGNADLTSEGLDFSIRLATDRRDSNYVIRPLKSISQVIVAAPAYLEKAGIPLTPAELANHACLVHTIKAPTGIWSFTHADGTIESVKVQGPIKSNFGDILLHSAIRGEGVAMHHKYMVDDSISQGKLCTILDGYSAGNGDVCLIYATRKRIPLRVRTLIDYLLLSK